MAKVQHYINAINNTTDMDELFKIRKTLNSYTSGRNPNLAYVEPLDLVRRKLFDLYGIEMRKGVLSSKSPVSNTNSNRGDSPKPKDWEAEAMEWKRIAEGYREALEKSIKGKDTMIEEWKSKYLSLEESCKQREKELEEKLLEEKKMGLEWKDKIEMLSEKIRLAMEDYDRDMKEWEGEIQELKREHARVLEERNLEAKKKEEALYKNIEELQGEIERLREEMENRESPQVSSQPIPDSPRKVKIKCYADSKMYFLLKEIGMDHRFIVRSKYKDFVIKHREKYEERYLGETGNGKKIDTKIYSDNDKERNAIISIIKREAGLK